MHIGIARDYRRGPYGREEQRLKIQLRFKRETTQQDQYFTFIETPRHKGNPGGLSNNTLDVNAFKGSISILGANGVGPAEVFE